MTTKPSARKVKAWAVIDCDWNTVRQIESYRHRLLKPECKACYVGQVEIRPISRKRGKKK